MAQKAPLIPTKVARTIVIGGLGLLTGGLLFLLGREAIRKVNWKSAIDDTDNTESPAYFAQRLHQGMNPDTPGGWGTDEELIRRTIKAVPHRKFWDLVKVAYRRLTKGGSLMEDLAKDLSRSEKQGIDMILAVLPANEQEAQNQDPDEITPAKLHAWAVRIRSAAEYEASWIWPYGTDEAAIEEVLVELPSVAAACQLDQTYQRLYGKRLFQELRDELSVLELINAYAKLQSKPDGRGKSIAQIISSCNRR